MNYDPINAAFESLHMKNKAMADAARIERLEAENAKLKAEVERLRSASFTTMVSSEQYDRVVKAGDAMKAWIGIIGRKSTCAEVEEWLRAKKGLPSLDEQYEKNAAQGWYVVLPPMTDKKEGQP